MSDTSTTTTTPGPNYPSGGSVTDKVNSIVGATGTPTTSTDIQTPGVPKGATPASGRPPKKVVDENGNTTYTFYDPTADANFLLSTMNPKTRDDVLQILYEHGQYGGSKRGNGIQSQDINAFADLLYYSNAKGVPWNEALVPYKKDFSKDPSLVPGSGRRAPIQVTNTNDIKAVFKKTAQSLLGRTVDDKIADSFVSMIQAQERAQAEQVNTQSGGVVQQTPDVAVMAQKTIEDKFAVEQRVQNAANAASIIDRMVKGLAR